MIYIYSDIHKHTHTFISIINFMGEKIFEKIVQLFGPSHYQAKEWTKRKIVALS